MDNVRPDRYAAIYLRTRYHEPDRRGLGGKKTNRLETSEFFDNSTIKSPLNPLTRDGFHFGLYVKARPESFLQENRVIRTPVYVHRDTRVRAVILIAQGRNQQSAHGSAPVFPHVYVIFYIPVVQSPIDRRVGYGFGDAREINRIPFPRPRFVDRSVFE